MTNKRVLFGLKHLRWLAPVSMASVSSAVVANVSGLGSSWSTSKHSTHKYVINIKQGGNNYANCLFSNLVCHLGLQIIQKHINIHLSHRSYLEEHAMITLQQKTFHS